MSGPIVYDWGAQAGVRAAIEDVQNQFSWGRKELSIVYGAQISGAARDAGATPTSVLRPGLALGLITATKLWKEYNPASTDGSEVCRGFLAGPALRMVDIDGNNANRQAAIIVAGPVKAASVYGLDLLARAQLQGRVIFDDLVGNTMGWQQVVAKAADYTVLPADNNRIFTTRGAAGAVNFTLPTLARGLRFRFFNEAGQNMTVTAAAADTMVVFNDLAADSIAFATASELIGGAIEVVANDNASKWLVFVNLGAETQTPTIAT